MPRQSFAAPVAFARGSFCRQTPFTVIGGGEIGGKASGLALALRDIVTSADGVVDGAEIFIPTMVVVATDTFETFMIENRLYEALEAGPSDSRIAHAFLESDLPVPVVGDLRALVEQVTVPLAVRSSSVLEDALGQPFAGVYATKMTPNNQTDPDSRFGKLVEAVKLVYASTFFREARSYRSRNTLADRPEAMAVIIQEVVGERFGPRFYPIVSAVARSLNYYAYGHARPEDGLAILALGLGRTIVEGESGWSYSPAFPKAPPPVNDVVDLLDQSQRKFWAVNMEDARWDPVRETEHLVHCDLGAAEVDDVLRLVASTFDPQAHRIVSGTSVPGPRVVNFAPLLQYGQFPVNEAISVVLKAAERALGGPVEIELAIRLGRGGTAQVGFLQVRPTVTAGEGVDVAEEELNRGDLLAFSESCLGNGRIVDVTDVVYVRPRAIDRTVTTAVAHEIALLNDSLLARGRRYVLIGVGRWGTSDPTGGIPVQWSDIGGADVIVEASGPTLRAELSQGSHFFHNLTSFGALFFSVEDWRVIDWAWLDASPAEHESAVLRHVRLQQPLEVAVDGRSRRGVIIRHE